jgi:DNA-binding XRE family transcriptional regulator
MDFQSLGQKIKHLRSERGMSQQTLADQAGISRVTLAALEAGRVGDVGKCAR